MKQLDKLKCKLGFHERQRSSPYRDFKSPSDKTVPNRPELKFDNVWYEHDTICLRCGKDLGTVKSISIEMLCMPNNKIS